MCTAMLYKAKDSYFGRNLDLGYTYNEQVAITPRNYSFNYRNKTDVKGKYAIIGMAYIKDDYPLYYDGINEAGLGIAGLNFPYNAKYNDVMKEKINITSFELIPYILSVCKNVPEASEALLNANITNICFSPELPVSPLHWIIADSKSAIVVESVEGGLKVYDNPYGILTNNPPFEKQITNLSKYKFLKAEEEENIRFDEYFSQGSGAIGLPGDWSSQSRFVKAAFVNQYSRSNDNEEESVGQFFHMLSSVEMPKGCVRLKSGDEITQYSSCCNLKLGRYFYTTYKNRQINCVDMHKADLDSEKIISYPLCNSENIFHQN